MHLRDTKVDLDGNAYATGRIDFPPDKDGLFTASAAGGEIRLNFDRNSQLTLEPCQQTRDPVTGFLQGAPTGSVWALPGAVAAMVLQGLRAGAKNPLSLTTLPGGQLYVHALPASPLAPLPTSQHLSDIRVDVDEVGGRLRVRLSASLRATQPAEPRHAIEKDLDNHWPADGEPHRITAEFTLDEMTQAVRFGKPVRLPAPPLEDEPLRAPRTSLSTLRLEHALIGWHELFGVSDAGWPIVFYQGPYAFPTIAISASDRKRRRIDGLISSEGYHQWSRIWLYGVGLDAVARQMANQTRVRMLLAGEHVGQVEYTGGHGGHACSLREVDLQFDLTTDGLVMSYRVLPAEKHRYAAAGTDIWMSGRLTLAWELLILRFPQFTWYREKIAGAAP